MKKTRAEKKLADLRRTLAESTFSEGNVGKGTNTITSKQPSTGIENAENNQKQVPSRSESIYIYPVQLIRKDLTKTLVLCILAISLELSLYLLLEKPGLLPF